VYVCPFNIHPTEKKPPFVQGNHPMPDMVGEHPIDKA
jgi:hypothetical protein